MSEYGIQVSENCFVSKWVIEGAPFEARPSATREKCWIVYSIGRRSLTDFDLSEGAAKARAEELNELAAKAIMMKGVYPD